MNPDTPLTLSISGAVVAALLGAWLLVRLQLSRRKSPEELERLRCLHVNRHGRLTRGQVVEMIEPEPCKPGARLIVYQYEVAGVKYEAAQDITAFPGIVPLARRMAGHDSSLKYDPGRPTSSILVCEEWSGLTAFEERSKPKHQAAQALGEALEKP